MILILTQCFPSRVGGIESLISNLALQLRKKNKVIVFADRHHLFYDSIYDNLHKNEILIRRTGGIKFFRRRKKIKEIKPFIDSNNVKFIVADTWKSLELGIEYINSQNIPVICLAHGNELLSKNKSKKNRIYNTLSKVPYIIANSKYTFNLVKKILPENKMIKYIYPGANDLYSVASQKFINISGNPILLTLSRLEKRKGHLEIIKAVAKLILQHPNLKYFIAGEGSEKTKLKKIVKQYSLEKNIKFTGAVNDSQKKYLFENADLMVMPTLDESNKLSIEGFGISYIEAAFHGIPSIASNIGGTPEAVIHNETGIIVNGKEDLYNALDNLLSNQDKIKQLGQNAKKRAISNFSWEVVIKDFISVIEELS